MHSTGKIVEDWVKSPIISDIGTIWLGGHLRSNSQIPRNKMRILGKYALVLVHDGQVYYEDALARRKELKSGDAILVTPDLAHAYGSISRQTWSQTYVVFDGPQFDLLQQSEKLRSRQPVWRLDSIHQWAGRLETQLRHPTETDANLGIRLVGAFTNLLIEMMTDKRPVGADENNWLSRSIHLLSNPDMSDWKTPQEVASLVGLSYENFRKLFTRRTGFPPAKFQRQRKIERACASIYRGSSNFKALAEELNFCDVYHFSKAFRQVKGIPPSTYRKSVLGA